MMPKNNRKYIQTQDFTSVNKTYLSEEFNDNFLDITQEAEIEIQCRPTDMILSRPQSTDGQSENLTSKGKFSAILPKIIKITNQYIIHLPEALKQIIQEVCDGIEFVHFATVLLYDQQKQNLELVAKIGIDVDKLFVSKIDNIQENCDFYRTLLDHVLNTGAAKLFQKSAGSLDYPVSPFAGYTPSSMYAIPINSPHLGRLGVLAVGNWDNTHAFDTTSPEIFLGVTNLMAIAIHHTQLRQQLDQQAATCATQTAIILEQQHQLEKQQHKIQQQNHQLIQAANHKSEFFATTSHELRTPLNVILGLSQVLLRQRSSSLSEEQMDMIERIISNGNYLRDIIEDMFNFAKVRTGHLAIYPEEFNLSSLVMATVADHYFQALEKDLNLRADINLNHPIVVNDSRLMHQILVKLLSNAIKFTDTGEIVVKLWEIGSQKIAIAIQDSGIGIAEVHREAIFEPLRQVDQSITRKYEGAGLGLAIAKSFVELMQGKISFTSKLGEGSTFYIELPREI
ncbi:ATP-binding protein [Nostoc sp. FACHB-110]|uniref:sensor histidine kinase n=1 Tax=Nostoc sp. FACHB-110 TaxID=2692834 RepID=UPI0016841C35|nr:ATP-binding protein [Nostoc sp. FACHB-110]MBD2437618.1 hypothetical protein [Nostoc sp. FACHB-110]